MCALLATLPRTPSSARAADVTKRAAKQADGFAASSFANNGAEWACGFLLGSSLCVLCTAAAARRATRDARPERLPPLGAPPARQLGRIGSAVRAWLLAAGGALCVASLVAALLIGLTWDNAHGIGPDEDPGDAAILTILGALLLLVIGLQWVVVRIGTQSARLNEVALTRLDGEAAGGHATAAVATQNRRPEL